MKHLNILIIFLAIMIISCSKNNSCGVEDPTTDLAWLHNMIDGFENDEISQEISLYTYLNEDTYLVEDCKQCADALTILYNCEGEKVCEFGGIDGRNTCPDFTEKGTFSETLYLD